MRIGYEVTHQSPRTDDGGDDDDDDHHDELELAQTKRNPRSLSPVDFYRTSLSGFKELGLNHPVKKVSGSFRGQRCEPNRSKFTDPNRMCNGAEGSSSSGWDADQEREVRRKAHEQEEPLDFSSKGKQRHLHPAPPLRTTQCSADLRVNGSNSTLPSPSLLQCPTQSLSPKKSAFPAVVKSSSAENFNPTDLSTKEIVRNKIELRLAELRSAGYGAPSKRSDRGNGTDESNGEIAISNTSQWTNFRKDELLLVEKMAAVDDLRHSASTMVPRPRQAPELLQIKNCLVSNATYRTNDNLTNRLNMISSFNMLAANGFGDHVHGQHLPNVPMNLLSSSVPTSSASTATRHQVQQAIHDNGDSAVKLSRPFKSYPRDAMLPLSYCGLPLPFLSAATSDLLAPTQGLADSFSSDSYEDFKRQIRQLQLQQTPNVNATAAGRRHVMTDLQAHFNGAGNLPMSVSHLVLPRPNLRTSQYENECYTNDGYPLGSPLERKATSQKVTGSSRDTPLPSSPPPPTGTAVNSSSSMPSSRSPSPTAMPSNIPSSAVGIRGDHNESAAPTFSPHSAANHSCASPLSSSNDSTAACHHNSGTNPLRTTPSPDPSPEHHHLLNSNSNSNLNFSGMLNNGSSKKRGRSLPDELKDEAYWERRRKNNEAAKRSRDARRAKEDEIAIRAAFLEQENLKLRVEVAALKSETAKLRCLLYNS